jgi:hypothetical protein
MSFEELVDAEGRSFGEEKYGKRNSVTSVSESWAGIGVVAGFGAVVLILQGPHRQNSDMHWRITLLQARG